MPFKYGVYFTERARNRVVRWDPDTGTTRVVAGGAGAREPSQSLQDPYGLAIDSDGNLLISDKLNHRICRLRNGRLETLNLRDVDGHRKRAPEAHPVFGIEHLQCPCSLFAERGGSLLCAFYDDHTIYRIHRDGRLELVVGIIPKGRIEHLPPREFVPPTEARSAAISCPVGVVPTSDGTIFFIERLSGVVREFHPERGLRSIFPHAIASEWAKKQEVPDRGNLSEYFPAFPATLALDRQERLFLCDPVHRCVLMLDVAGGTFQKVVSTPRLAKAGGPLAVGFGPDGTSWVADGTSITAYGLGPDGCWVARPSKLEQVDGEALQFGIHGMSLVVGP